MEIAHVNDISKGVYSIFESERSSANIILTRHEALIRTVMIYAYPA
jgi:hypothetical protein